MVYKSQQQLLSKLSKQDIDLYNFLKTIDEYLNAGFTGVVPLAQISSSQGSLTINQGVIVSAILPK